MEDCRSAMEYEQDEWCEEKEAELSLSDWQGLFGISVLDGLSYGSDLFHWLSASDSEEEQGPDAA